MYDGVETVLRTAQCLHLRYSGPQKHTVITFNPTDVGRFHPFTGYKVPYGE
jgi:hypothetical protein